MIADTTTTVTAQLSAAASAAAQSWGLGDVLALGEPSRAEPELEFTGRGVLVEFTGRAAGELAIVVDDALAEQLLDSPVRPPDLVTALGPAVTAACLAFGGASPARIQPMDSRMALRRVLAIGESAAVLLTDGGAARAAVAVGSERPAPAPTAGRLDLLRGVEMEATAELGRARMTVNELLALRTGAVLELDRAAGAPADLYVNGRLIARGEVVVVDENYGLRIMQVVSDEAGR